MMIKCYRHNVVVSRITPRRLERNDLSLWSFLRKEGMKGELHYIRMNVDSSRLISKFCSIKRQALILPSFVLPLYCLRHLTKLRDVK